MRLGSHLMCVLREMKKLQNKNSEQKLLEQREQGFSLYLNGANASLQIPVRRHSRKATNRSTKTAGISLFIIVTLVTYQCVQALIG